MLLHDPERYSDNVHYWHRTIVFYKGKAVYVRSVNEDCTVTLIDSAGETISAVPMNSELLEVKPILSQYINERQIHSTAQRRRRKGIQFDIGSHSDLKLVTKALTAGDVTQYFDGYAYIFNQRYKAMTPAQYAEFKKEFVCR